MSLNVTRVLKRIDAGDKTATAELLPLVYEELRRLARSRLALENPGHSLTATALVHEAYFRLVGDGEAQTWDNRGHFFAAAAEAMRRVLLNRARDRNRLKRGGEFQRVDFSSITVALETPPEILIELDEAISALAEEDPVAAELVKLKYFGGLSLQDASSALALSRRQGDRLWAFARAWLLAHLQED